MTRAHRDGAAAKPRILVVEDEFLIAREIADALEDAGFAVLGPCPTVPAALARLDEAGSCEAAVLDASLRHVSSLPVAEALMARGIPFAVVTGFSVGQLPPAMAEAPVLAKPLDAGELVRLLNRLLRAG